MKKVLIIAYDFPPARTSGVYRPLKFARYLPEFGWEPVILTVSNHGTPTRDESLLAQLPANTKIYRAYSVEPKRWEKAVFKTLYGRQGTPAADGPTANGGQTAPGGFSPKALVKRLLLSPMSRFTHNFVYLPDEVIGWAPHAIFKGLQAIRREGIDLIFSTSPPETNHVVGIWLKRLTGKPWVADFRDPWTDNVIKYDKSDMRRRIERRMEMKVLQRSDAIVHVGHRFAQLSRESFPSITPDKHLVITNGYDESDFSGVDGAALYAANKSNVLNLLNVGTIYDISGFPALVQALQKIVSNPEYAGKICVTFIGELLPEQKAALAQEPIRSHVRLLGFRPHRETLTAMMGADALLLMPSGADARTNDKIVPGKLYELIRIGRPVLLIGWEGEAADIVRQSGTGRFVEAADPAGLVRALEDFYERKAAGTLDVAPRADFVSRYDRRQLTADLAGLFNNLIGIKSSRQNPTVKVA